MVGAIDSLKRWWALSAFVALFCLGAGAAWASAQPPTPNLWNVAFASGATGVIAGMLVAVTLGRLKPASPIAKAPAPDPLPSASTRPMDPEPTRAPRVQAPPRRSAHPMVQRRAGITPRIVEPPPRQ